MTTVDIQNITKYYGEQKALDSIFFSISKGEVLGLLGPNGAGKSTLMKILTSVIPASSGKISVNGLDIETDSLDIRKLIGYLPEHNPLYPEMYVREYLNYVLNSYPGTNQKSNKVEEVISLTGLAPESNKKIAQLSKGYRQRVGLAQALIHDPEILVLDEPTSGLDPNQLVEIRNIITDLGKIKTIILSTHIMQEVESLCSRVIIIDKGRIIADDSPSNLTTMFSAMESFRLELKETVEEIDISKISGATNAEKVSAQTWVLTSNGIDIRENIFSFAVDNGYHVLSLTKENRKMEDIFHHLTRRDKQ